MHVAEDEGGGRALGREVGDRPHDHVVGLEDQHKVGGDVVEQPGRLEELQRNQN